MFAGPSAPAMAGVRIAPVTTTGSGPACSRSSRYAVSSMVSVPWITTTPTAPAAIRSLITAARSKTSPMVRDAPGTRRKSCTSIAAPRPASPGTASRSCGPVSAGTTPEAPETPPASPDAPVMAMVPPRVNTATQATGCEAVMSSFPSRLPPRQSG